MYQITMNQVRRTGLEVLGERPWGTHFCVFYETESDLVEMLTPYFRTGIDNNERCFWVLAGSVREEDARSALHRDLPEVDRRRIERHIEFMPSESFYRDEGRFDVDRIIGEWNERLRRALAAGYDGIRVSGDPGWLLTQEWPAFWKYERHLNEALGDQPMLALCTYPLTGSRGADVLDVAHTHQCAVSLRGGAWDVIEKAALKEAKEEIEKLNAELEQRVVERTQELSLAQAELARIARVTTTGQLATSITHEIAQPVAAMMTHATACLQWLSRPAPDIEEVRSSVHSVIRNGELAQQVFKSVRSLVRRATPQMGPLELNDVIAEALALAGGTLRRQHVALEVELAPMLPPLRGDRIQLQQVLVNLITNAIEAMSTVDERSRVLTIRSSVAGEHVLAAVEDTGVGLAQDRVEAIFQQQFTTKPEGMGLGLSISRSIVNAHHGRIWAEPRASGGTMFRVLLPIDGSSEPMPSG